MKHKEPSQTDFMNDVFASSPNSMIMCSYNGCPRVAEERDADSEDLNSQMDQLITKYGLKACESSLSRHRLQYHHQCKTKDNKNDNLLASEVCYSETSTKDSSASPSTSSSSSLRPLQQQKQQQKKVITTTEDDRINDALLDGSFDAIFLTDSRGNIQQVNEACLKLFGYESRQELVGQNIASVIGGPHASNHEHYFKGATQQRLDSILDKMRDVVAKRKDETEFPVQVGIRAIESNGSSNNNDKEGSSNRMFVAYCHDLSQSKSQLSKLEDEARINDALLDGSFDAIFVTDSKGDICKVNSSAMELFGYATEQELKGQNIAQVIGGPHAGRHSSYFRGATQRRLDAILDKMRDVTAKRKDGSEFPVQVGIRAIETTNDNDDSGRMFVAYCHDLTQHKAQLSKIRQEKQELIKAKELQDSLFDTCFDSIIVTDKVGTIIKVNNVCLEEFGFDSTELIGQNLATLVGGGHAKHHANYMKRFHDRGGQSTLLGKLRKVMARRKDGTEFPCQIGIRNVNYNGEGLMVGYVRNISTELEAMQLAIEKQAAEDLLVNMLPEEVAIRLKDDPGHLADHFNVATVLFADIVGFTSMANEMEPIAVVTLLNDLFSRFDEALDKYGLNKVKTIGDCYMVTSIPGTKNQPKACSAVCHFAMDLIQELDKYNAENPQQRPLSVRVGVNCGSVVAGVVGKKRFMYDIWGHAVNMASRMESTGVPGRIQVSQSILDNISMEEFSVERRGMVHVKGIGEVETFFLNDRQHNLASQYWEQVRRNSKDERKFGRLSRTLDILRSDDVQRALEVSSDF